MPYAFVFVVALFAFALSVMSGGGAGLLLIPVIGFVLPALEVPAALSIGTTASAASRSLVFRRSIRWDVVCWFVPAALPAAVFGVWLLSIAQPLWIEFLLGLFLAANLALILRRHQPKERLSLTPGALLAIGAVAGFLSGFTGAVGVVLNGAYIRLGLSKDEIVATRGANELLLHVIKIALYASFGMLSRSALEVGLLLALAAILSSLAARPLVDYVEESFFRRLNYAAMGFAGVAMLWSAGGALATQYQVAVTGKVGKGVISARLHLPTTSVALEWQIGALPQIERTLDARLVPQSVLEAADDLREAGVAGAARYEKVHSIKGVSYEVEIGGIKRQLVVTD